MFSSFSTIPEILPWTIFKNVPYCQLQDYILLLHVVKICFSNFQGQRFKTEKQRDGEREREKERQTNRERQNQLSWVFREKRVWNVIDQCHGNKLGCVHCLLGSV